MAGATALSELKRAPAEEVRLAVPDDDAELRALLRRSIVDGAVKLAFTREPSFFAADRLAGASDTTIVARTNGRIAGLGRASVLSLLRNGQSNRTGYLAALRVDAGVRASPRLIRRGYELLFAEADASATGFFTSISVDNDRARRVLEHGTRLGIPAYTRISDLVTLVAPVGIRMSSPRKRGPSVVTTEPVAIAELTDFLAVQSRKHQLGLSWDEELWNSLARHGVRPHDFVVVRQNGEIVACAAVWDQAAFKQTVIHGYSSALGLSRAVLNALRTLSGQPSLPPPGSILRQGAVLGGYATKPEYWRQLWPAVMERARTMNLSWLTLCRDVRDPESGTLRRLTRGREYLTTLYSVGQHLEPWDGRLFRPEVGLL